LPGSLLAAWTVGLWKERAPAPGAGEAPKGLPLRYSRPAYLLDHNTVGPLRPTHGPFRTGYHPPPTPLPVLGEAWREARNPRNDPEGLVIPRASATMRCNGSSAGCFGLGARFSPGLRYSPQSVVPVGVARLERPVAAMPLRRHQDIEHAAEHGGGLRLGNGLWIVGVLQHQTVENRLQRHSPQFSGFPACRH
jgi:hypothetical protein